MGRGSGPRRCPRTPPPPRTHPTSLMTWKPKFNSRFSPADSVGDPAFK